MSPVKTITAKCLGTLGWEIPNPLPPCNVPVPSPGYVVARDNGSFAGGILTAAVLCDAEHRLELPEVKTYLDMVQILANVTGHLAGISIPVSNNILK